MSEYFSHEKPPNRNIYRAFQAAIAAGVLLIEGSAAMPNSHKILPGHVHQIKNESKPGVWDFNIYGRFHATDNKGNHYINWDAILSPIQLEVGRSLSPEHKRAVIGVPYRYSRAFDTGKAVDDRQREQAEQFMQAEMRKQFGERLVLWLWNKKGTADAYRDKHEGAKNYLSGATIQEIKLTGIASPEGPEQKGKNTILPGHIDPENLSLAKRRAADMDPVVRTALHTLGIDDALIRKSGIQGEEAQFNDTEIADLAKEARHAGITHAVDDIEAAYLLIKAYNAGQIKEEKNEFASTKHLLDIIVGSKRMVEVEITYDEKKKIKDIIPLPVLLLLLARPGIRFGKTIRERFVPTIDTGNSENRRNERRDRRVSHKDPKFLTIWDNAIHSKQIKSWGNMQERFMVDELNPYLGTKNDDIGYLYIVQHGSWKKTEILKEITARKERYAEQIAELKADLKSADNAVVAHARNSLDILQNAIQAPMQEFEREIALNLLSKWQNNDHLVRQQHGEYFSAEIDYWEDPEKVLWAREAARVLIHLMGIYKKGKGRLYMEGAVYAELAEQIRDLQSQQRFEPDVPRRKRIRKGRTMHRDDGSFLLNPHRKPLKP